MKPSGSEINNILVSCKLIPLAKIMDIGLKINLKLLLDFWNVQDGRK
jgi:hypothetical protein